MNAPITIIVEDLDGSLWVAATRKNQITAIELDPYDEFVRWGSIYWAKVTRIDTATNAAFVDLGHGLTGMLPATEIPGLEKGVKIGKVLRPGAFVIVQVKTPRQPVIDEITEEINPDQSKASRVSMDIALAGRYLIYTPLSPGNRVSRRIKDKALRQSMLSMIKDVEDVQNCIMRASAASAQTDLLIREARIQRAIWESLQEFITEPEPALLMLGPDALTRVLGDFAGARIGAIEIADDERLEEASNWCELYAPELGARIESRSIENTRMGMGLFEVHDLLGQIEDLLRDIVILPCGGNFIIEHTSAGTMIDVNSGPAALGTANHEAALEIARQIRLRNIGGAILVDFAGKLNKASVTRLHNTLQKAFNDDPCTVESHGITTLGFFEISRSRRTPTLIDRLTLIQSQ